MSAGGVIPAPEERKPDFTQTGVMYAGPVQIVFGTEGDRVVLIIGPDIVLDRHEQDLFARHLFRAMTLAEERGEPPGAPF
jgi:hypothetical protein